MLPQAGGLYVFLRAAYGPLPAFLFGWVEFLVVRSGSMATLAAAFAQYFAHVVEPPAPIPAKIWQAGAAVLAIAVVTTVNVLGTRRGGALQVVGTALKVGGIAILIALPFLLGGGSRGEPLADRGRRRQTSSTIFAGVMAAMVGVLWAYDGWSNVTPLAEEIRDPGRNIPRALLFGHGRADRRLPGDDAGLSLRPADGRDPRRPAAMPSTSSRPSPRSIATTCSAGGASWAISMLVMCSTFIALNGNALAGPRAYFAMARDGLFPAGLCRVHPRFQTPANAIISQGVLAIFLIVAGTFLIMVPADRLGADAALGRSWRLEDAQRDAALRRALHLRDLRRPHLLHAGDRQRVRPARPPPGPARGPIGRWDTR